MLSILEHFIQGYTTCLLWSTPGETAAGEDVSDLLQYELSDEAKLSIAKDCEKFITENKNLLSEVYTFIADYQDAGHNFWLTRNHHGTGFWDRGFGVVGDALTDRSKEFKEQSPYLGDDDKVYLS